MPIYDQRRVPKSSIGVPAVLATTFLAATPVLADRLAEANDIAFGTRPGNVIGTGSSLPTSDQASNITEVNTRSRIAPRLPAPQIVSDSPQELLGVASRALEAGRTGEAQEALERAETRLLTRSVPLAEIERPDAEPLVAQIVNARLSLAAGDQAQTARLIEAILSPGVVDAQG